MTGSALFFMVIFWGLILGMSGVTLNALLTHESKQK